MKAASILPVIEATKAAHSRSFVPKFALYGEHDAGSMMIHMENVQERSRLYQWDINAHLHTGYYQLVFVLSGPVSIALDELRSDGAAPVVAIIPSGVVHAFQFAAETEGYVLTVNTRWPAEGDAEMNDLYRVLFSRPRIVSLTSSDGSADVDVLLRELMSEFRQPDGPRSPVTGWLTRSVLWRLARWLENSGENQTDVPGQSDLFNRYRLLVEAHYLEHWEISRYAELLGLTVERLNRLCRHQAGVSAFEIVQDRLLREACRRLIYIVMPVSQLAYELGFADPGYFCRFFKRRTGISPNQYRKQHRGFELNRQSNLTGV